MTKIGSLFAKKVASSILAGGARFKKLDMTYPLLKPQEITEGIELLRENLPRGRGIIYRGSEGTEEILQTMRTGFVGRKITENKKESSLDVVRYTVDNDSKYFLSFSPCERTVKPYAAGISIVPCKGYIMVTGMPKVYTVPHKIAYLNPDMVKDYALATTEGMSIVGGNITQYHSIKGTLANNNELTVVLGGDNHEDWRPSVASDMKSVIEVCGPGRILSKFMSSTEPAFVRQWDNPWYKKRLYAIEIVCPLKEEEFDVMNRNARSIGLISDEERLLRMEDAQMVMQSQVLDNLSETHIIDETMCFVSVPKEIPIGSSLLVEYVKQTLESSIRPREEADEDLEIDASTINLDEDVDEEETPENTKGFK